MSNMILSVLSVIFFCLCCYQFIKSTLRPIPTLNMTGYNKSALRIKKNYQIFSWGMMTFTFLFALVVTFAQVYTEL